MALKCCRCKREFGLVGSAVVTKVSGDNVELAHFFCATPTEVKALYGKLAFDFPLEEEPKKGQKER